MGSEADVEARDAEELARLVRFMTRPGRRFGLALARYNDAGVAEEMREQACARAGVRTATVVAQPGQQLLEQLVEAGRERDVVFVIGLDDIAYDASEQGPITQAIVELNFRRDELPERLDVRVIFWISTEAYGQLARLAWDLLDVMLLRFEFSAEREPPPEQPRELAPTKPAWMVIPDDANVDERRMQAESFADVARTTTNEFTQADAAASAGQLFASIGQLEEAARWLGEAAAGYERLGQGQGNAQHTLAAATQLRRGAEVARLRADVETARRLAERSAELAGMVMHETRGGAREQIAALGVLASVSEGEASSDEVDDHKLVARWRAGDRTAGDQLVRRNYSKIRRYFLSMVPEDAVDELVQETFMEAFRGNLDSVVPFGTHLVRAARLIWRRWLRRGLRRRRHESVDFSEAEVQDVNAGDWLTDVFQKEDLSLLRDALQSIPVADQELLELYYWNGTSRELAEIIGVPDATVRSRLRVASQRLRVTLDQLKRRRAI